MDWRKLGKILQIVGQTSGQVSKFGLQGQAQGREERFRKALESKAMKEGWMPMEETRYPEMVEQLQEEPIPGEGMRNAKMLSKMSEEGIPADITPYMAGSDNINTLYSPERVSQKPIEGLGSSQLMQAWKMAQGENPKGTTRNRKVAELQKGLTTVLNPNYQIFGDKKTQKALRSQVKWYIDELAKLGRAKKGSFKMPIIKQKSSKQILEEKMGL